MEGSKRWLGPPEEDSRRRRAIFFCPDRMRGPGTSPQASSIKLRTLKF